MFRAILLVAVLAGAVAAADSVWTEPARPTTRDSITFHLFLEHNCCCTQYYNKGVTAEDTVVYLFHEFDSDQCMACMCLMPGSWTEFVSAPLAAGTYAVYSAGQIYCAPGEMCPLGMMAPVWVGEITVRGPAATSRGATRGTIRPESVPGALYTLDGRPVAGTGTTGVVIERSGVTRAVLVR